MATDAEMQARIAELAGKINRHKQQQQQQSEADNAPGQPFRGNQYPHNHRFSPYATPRGRGRGGYGQTFQNRTLVNTSASSSTSNTPPPQNKQQYLQNTYEKGQLARHFNKPETSRELVIEGVRFSMKEDGSKLTRLSGEHRITHGYNMETCSNQVSRNLTSDAEEGCGCGCGVFPHQEREPTSQRYD